MRLTAESCCLLILLAACATGGEDFYDFDNDGSPDDEDCQPENPEVHPGAVDFVDQAGEDENCDGIDGTDTDRDGYASIETGGEDCNDADPNIHPGVEDTDDTVDMDCDGFKRNAELDLLPDVPTTIETLLVLVTTETSQFDLTWFVDDIEQPQYADQQLIETYQTFKGQRWRVVLTPYNSSGQAGPTAEDSVVILNTPPLVGSVSIQPEEPTTDTPLQAVPSGWYDPDLGETEAYSYQWFVDENPAGDGSATLEAIHFLKDQTVTVTVTPDDGTPWNKGEEEGVNSGPTNNALGLSVPSESVTIVNSTPSITSVAINPTSGSRADTFSCVPQGWFDPDVADPEAYTWLWAGNSAIPGDDDDASDDDDATSTEVTTQTISGDDFHAGDILQCTATPINTTPTGTHQGDPRTSDSITVENNLPSITGVGILPDTGTELDQFTCTPQGWMDLDDDPEEYTWQWKVDGAAVATTQMLENDTFEAGDLLLCSATPINITASGTDSGSTRTSATVTVANTPPTITGVSIEPTSGTEATTFSCNPTGWFDVDPTHNEDYVYQWFVGPTGSEVASVTTETITGTDFDKGDSIYCIATPYDGMEFGGPQGSGPIVVQNTLPSIDSATIGPSSGQEESVFRCDAAGWEDPDPGDPEEYRWSWQVNFSPSVASQTITGTHFDKGDSLHCTATPINGGDTGPSKTSSGLIVDNTEPSISGVTVDPASGGEETTFTCIPSGWHDPDPADIEGYTYQWFVGPFDSELTSVRTAQITGAFFAKGDSIYCVATPYDDLEYGVGKTSDRITVDNTAPSVTSVVITPADAYTTTTLTAVPSGWYDPDPGDVEDYTYEWFALSGDDDDSSLGHVAIGTGSNTLDSTEFRWDQTIRVTVTPHDGSTPGTPVDAATGVSIQNTIPSTPEISVAPPFPTPDDDLICSITTAATDPDVDEGAQSPLTYDFKWSVGGVHQSHLNQSGLSAGATATVDSSEVSHGDVWYCEVNAWDDLAQGPSSIESVTAVATAGCSVSNAPPGSCNDDSDDDGHCSDDDDSATDDDDSAGACGGCEDNETRNVLTLYEQQLDISSWTTWDYSTSASTVEAWFRADPGYGPGTSTDYLLTTKALSLHIGSSTTDAVDDNDLMPSGQSGIGQLAYALVCHVSATTTETDVRARSETKVNVSPNGWHHLACVFDQGELRVYFDGVLEFSYQPGGEIIPDLGANLGLNTGTHHHDVWGWIDEIRYSSVARYGADFTPARRHTPDCGTVFLWHMDVPGNTIEDAGPDDHDLLGADPSCDFTPDTCYEGLFTP